MKVTIISDKKELEQAITKAPEQVVYGIRRALRRAGIRAQAGLRREAPVGVSGELRREITVKEKGLSVEVGSESKHNRYVVSGTRPHWVSVRRGSPLRRWAESKGISPYAVQHSIARKGTRSNNYVERYSDKNKNALFNEFATTFRSEIKDIL